VSDPLPVDPAPIDAREIRRAIEHYYERGFTDGLPVVPPTESLVAEHLAEVDRPPDEVVAAMPHLNRLCDVRLAAINSVMAGCLPAHFPVVLAALDALRLDTGARRTSRFSSGLWQSTTGTVPLLVVNGPARRALGFNSSGNVFGPGFRANATVGRAIRLIALNAFGLQPHVLDQSTQSTPAKYTCCIAENEEESPWQPLSVEAGFDAATSTVALMMMRSTLHIEARSATRGQHVLDDIADSIARTGALYNETTACCVVFGPEHAALLAAGGWSKAAVKEYLAANATCTRGALERAGKTGLSREMRWLVPADHPDALPGEHPRFAAGTGNGGEEVHHVLSSPDDVVVLVAGAANAGVSTVIDLMGSSSSRSGGCGRVPAMAQIRFRRPAGAATGAEPGGGGAPAGRPGSGEGAASGASE